MRILYAALAIDLARQDGGATHVREVAYGLAARGHELLVVTGGRTPLPEAPGVRSAAFPVPKYLAFLAYPALARLADPFGPDAVMERYYNFAGPALLWARRRGVPALLEVNAPVVDPPGSLKDRVDRLLGRALRRYARWQVSASARIVTPLHTTVTVPFPESAAKVVELPWGANTDAFHPRVRRERRGEIGALARRYGLEGKRVLVFTGSFRAWHGVRGLVAAAAPLLREDPALALLLVGGGPEEEAVRAQAQALGVADRVVLTGRVPHEQVPLHLALGTVAVAPFDTRLHPPLRHFGFYWSPLKVFEAMAMELPLVVPDLPPLNRMVRDGVEGWTYPEGDLEGLRAALAAALADPEEARRRGQAARRRVVAEFSWAKHCEGLERALGEMVRG